MKKYLVIFLLAVALTGIGVAIAQQVVTPITATTAVAWEQPELNEDGTPCTDLSHYDVALALATATLNQGGEYLALKRVEANQTTTEVNVRTLFGSELLNGQQSLWVSAVDANGNRSRWAGPLILDNDSNPPGMPRNFRIKLEVTIGTP